MCYYCDLVESSEIKIKKLDPRAIVPSKRDEDSGYDVYGIIEEDYLMLNPGQNVIIGTGIAMEFPKGLGFIVGNRGSVGTKCVIVGAHVVDSGYRGEVKIDFHNISDRYSFITDLSLDELKKVFYNNIVKAFSLFYANEIMSKVFGIEPFIIPKSKALTQGMIVPTYHLPVRVVDELSMSERMSDAFGSTNKINR